MSTDDPHDRPIPELTPELAIEIGGWDTRYARVLAIAVYGRHAVSLIDPNGDENMTEVEHAYLDDTGHWRGGSSGGGSSDTYGVHGWGDYPGMRFAYGRAKQPGRQSVTAWDGSTFDVTPERDGWWVWAEAVPDDD